MEYKIPKFKPGDVVQYGSITPWLSTGRTPKELDIEDLNKTGDCWEDGKPIELSKVKGLILGLSWDSKNGEWIYEMEPEYNNRNKVVFAPEGMIEYADNQEYVTLYKEYVRNEHWSEKNKLKAKYEEKQKQLDIKYSYFYKIIETKQNLEIKINNIEKKLKEETPKRIGRR